MSSISSNKNTYNRTHQFSIFREDFIGFKFFLEQQLSPCWSCQQCGPCLFHHINTRAHLTVTTDEGDEGDQGDQGNHGELMRVTRATRVMRVTRGRYTLSFLEAWVKKLILFIWNYKMQYPLCVNKTIPFCLVGLSRPGAQKSSTWCVLGSFWC